MSLDRILGVLGIAVSALGIGIAILFPTARLIGWFFLGLGVILIASILANRLLQPPEASTARAEPRILFDRVSRSPVRLGPQVNRNYFVDVWQLWFTNRPTANSAEATARNMTAFVEFCDDEWRPVRSMIGQWAITEMPEHVGWRSLENHIDLPPVHTFGKLLLLIQNDVFVEHVVSGVRETQRGVYAAAGENLHERRLAGDHPDYALPRATRVRVRLAAENMDEQEFQFRIERQVDGTVTGLDEIRP